MHSHIAIATKRAPQTCGIPKSQLMRPNGCSVAAAPRCIVRRTSVCSYHQCCVCTMKICYTMAVYFFIFFFLITTKWNQPHFDNRTEIKSQAKANSWLQKTCFIWHNFVVAGYVDEKKEEKKTKRRNIRQRHQVTRFNTKTTEYHIQCNIFDLVLMLMLLFVFFFGLFIRFGLFSLVIVFHFFSSSFFRRSFSIFTVGCSHSVVKWNAYRSSFKNGTVRSLLKCNLCNFLICSQAKCLPVILFLVWFNCYCPMNNQMKKNIH